MKSNFLRAAILQALVANPIKPIEANTTNISDSPFISREVPPPPQRKRPYVQKLVPNLTDDQKNWNAKVETKKKLRKLK